MLPIRLDDPFNHVEWNIELFLLNDHLFLRHILQGVPVGLAHFVSNATLVVSLLH